MPLRLGTRASALARWQAEWVAAQLRNRGIAVDLLLITTTGDQQQEAIRVIGGQGVFTKEIQRALLDSRIDLAVHCLKDLPTDVTPDLCLAAVPERAPPGDVLVLRDGDCSHSERSKESAARPEILRYAQDDILAPVPCPLSLLPHGATVGTGSLRRRSQLLHVRRDLQMKDIRGNVETRLRKLHQGDFDALILAEAGLRRLGLAEHIDQLLPLSLMLPAVGQGALGLETRTDDQTTRGIVEVLDHPPTHAAVLAERAMLSVLQGGCLAPIAALGRFDGEQLTLTGRVIGHDGAKLLEATEIATIPTPDQPSVDFSSALQLGRQVAEALLAQGAGELIDAARGA